MFRIKFEFCKRIIVEYALGKKVMDTVITVYIFFELLALTNRK